MAKKILSIKTTAVIKNENKNGGNVVFAVDVQPVAGNANQATARQSFNFQTTTAGDLEAVKVNKTYLITIEEV